MILHASVVFVPMIIAWVSLAFYLFGMLGAWFSLEEGAPEDFLIVIILGYFSGILTGIFASFFDSGLISW